MAKIKRPVTRFGPCLGSERGDERRAEGVGDREDGGGPEFFPAEGVVDHRQRGYQVQVKRRDTTLARRGRGGVGDMTVCAGGWVFKAGGTKLRGPRENHIRGGGGGEGKGGGM